jgi:hypothetical protein
VFTGVDGGGFDAASPVLVFGVEDTEVDERGQLRGVARRGKLQQLSSWHRQPVASVALALGFIGRADCLSSNDRLVTG